MDDLVDILRTENETLRERVRQLEALLLPEDIEIPIEWRLVNAERRIFAALTRREIVTKDMLYEALYGDRLDLDKEIEINCVESHVSKLKRKVKPFGVVIISRRFVGYSLLNREKYAHTPPVPVTKTVARHG
ncbi:winged helix-turn-helix domain-containing protein [Rhizobium chutanense]|uniref:Helix-turn-helix domain-containing protein n=1 Tax=Rhizobium chutanense TaxID=2035448 RepID=A0A3S0R1E3_9HYPH|nr:helix-turn-helix domain-containing protein [Rhizobium chutanense]RUM06788.1 helix-turn-helix domain-containing protein [Rhizobium chutanense]